MRPAKWTIGLKTQPLDPKGARQEARWLQLGDDALANSRAPETTETSEQQIRPGIRALTKLERATQEVRDALRKYQEKNKHPHW
jgi:hypothetical protein